MTASEWEKILEEVSKKVPSVYYGSFISSLSLLSFDDSKITLSAPSEIIKNHVSQKYQHFIEEAASKVSGRNLSIEILTDSSPNQIQPISNFVEERFQDQNFEFHSEFTLKNFLVSESNILAYKICQQIIEKPASYNPLYIFGGIGVGKTHLLQAVGRALNHENFKVKYTTASSFLSEFVYSLQSKSSSENFRTKYQSYSCILFDDLQYLGSTAEKTQEEFYHLLNFYYERKKQIIVAADRPLSELPLQERIRSRLMIGQLVEIQKPNPEIRELLIRKKMEEFDLALSDESIQFLIENFPNDLRNLIGSLSELSFYKKIYGLLILPHEKVVTILNNRLEKQNNPQNTYEKIIDEVCEHFGQERKDVLSKSRRAELILPRHTIMYLLHDVCKMSKSQIGKIFSTNHSAVIPAIKKIEQKQKNDFQFAKFLNEIRRKHEFL